MYKYLLWVINQQTDLEQGHHPVMTQHDLAMKNEEVKQHEVGSYQRSLRFTIERLGYVVRFHLPGMGLNVYTYVYIYIYTYVYKCIHTYVCCMYI